MDIITADTIQQYNQFFGVKTKHPQVGIIHFNRSENQPTHKMTFGFYALYLVKTVGITMDYGKTSYDFDDGTVICLAPGQTIGVYRMPGGPVPEAVGLMFHPDLLHGTTLAQKMKQFTFFSYASNEALHLSSDECAIIQTYMDNIQQELEHPIDKFSRQLFVSNIEVLLNYCMRFYERQFITRENKNKLLLARLDRMFDEYLDSGRLSAGGLPVLAQCAAALNLSAAYFSDLLKFETGKSLEEYFEFRRLDTARRLLSEGMHTPAAVARLLGYPTVQCFSLIFKRVVGVPPGEFRYSRN